MMTFVHLNILFVILLAKTNAQQNDSFCIPANIVYSICVVQDVNVSIVSQTFTADLLREKCHLDFVKETLGKPLCSDVNVIEEVPSTIQKVGYGFFAVSVISIMSLGGLLVFPIIYRISFQYILTIFVALAVGTLCGDTMFHLIPYVLNLHSHAPEEHDHTIEADSSIAIANYQWKMLIAVIALYGFYLLEVVLHRINHIRHNKNTVHFHACGHIHAAQPETVIKDAQPNDHVETVKMNEIPVDNHRSHNQVHHHDYNEVKPTLTCMNSGCPYNHNARIALGIQEKPNVYDSNLNDSELSKVPKVTAWMIILGDGIHNFADGLAIGAAFSERLMLGFTTSIAIGCHELPHEFGDYAILIKSGFTHTKALFWNFLSATTAFIGFFIGVFLSTDEIIRQWIFAVTIGMFLYIALVDLLPTLLTDSNFQIKRFICVNIGLLLGVAIMFLLAIFEDKLIHLGT